MYCYNPVFLSLSNIKREREIEKLIKKVKQIFQNIYISKHNKKYELQSIKKYIKEKWKKIQIEKRKKKNAIRNEIERRELKIAR